MMQEFPISADRMPLQLLAYLRLARLQDPAQLALVGHLDCVFVKHHKCESTHWKWASHAVFLAADQL